MEFNFYKYVVDHMKWSMDTFGIGQRTEGLLKHISKEMEEVRESPNDLTEWIDIIILALDGAWRAGYSPLQICMALVQKQQANMLRKWPAQTSEDQPTEHIKPLSYCPCHLPEVHGHLEKNCPHYVEPASGSIDNTDRE